MPELHIQDLDVLPLALGSTDLYNVQRHDGVWKNYKTTNAAILGMDFLLFEQDYTFAELNPSPLEILADPGAGNAYFIQNAWARYNPGSTNGNQIVKVFGYWIEANQAFSALLRTNSAGNAAAMYWEFQTGTPFNDSGDRNLRILCETSPGNALPSGDGTITIHFEYAVIAL